MQRKHNLNHNYNMLGFDTIEINLESFITAVKEEHILHYYKENPYHSNEQT